MTNLREYVLNFLFRTSICMCALLLCYIAHRFWPEGLSAFLGKMFYRVDCGLLANELKELGRCVLPR